MNIFAKIFAVDSNVSTSSVLGKLSDSLGAELKDYTEEEKGYVVCLAGLLSSVANRDFEVCDQEKKVIARVLSEHSKLGDELGEKVKDITLSHGKELAGIDDYKYIRFLNSSLTVDEKKEVLRVLFLVAGANEDISSEEEHHIGLMARDLGLPRTTFIELRNEFSNYISSLQKMN